MRIKLFVSPHSGNRMMKLQQDHIRRVLEMKGIDFAEIDIADPRYEKDKNFMQRALQLNDDDLVALPPQIFKGDQYRGDYESFFKALENEHLFEYLDLEIPKNEVEYARKYQKDVQLAMSVHEVSYQ